MTYDVVYAIHGAVTIAKVHGSVAIAKVTAIEPKLLQGGISWARLLNTINEE